MPDDKSAGASYLNALEQPTPQAAGAAPARVPGSPSREKRRSLRYPCQGSAQLRENSSGMSTWATFTDISLQGCYVEAMSNFPVGARLTITLEVNGYRVTCGGEVRVAYPGVGMGIAFAVIGEEPRERLRELLRTLSRPAGISGPAVSADAVASPAAETAPPAASAGAVLKALTKFFEERQMLSRDEFLRILRRAQG